MAKRKRLKTKQKPKQQPKPKLKAKPKAKPIPIPKPIPKPKPKAKPKNDAPEKFEISYGESHMEIVKKWFPGCGVCIAGTVAIIAVTNVLIMMLSSNEPFMAGVGYLIGMLVVVYFSLAHVFNKTHIVVSRGMIEVRHRPLPWPGNKKLLFTELDQLYARKRIENCDIENGPSYTTYVHEVRVICSEGEHVTLIKSLESNEEALYIEQKIEEYLGIKNVSVAGEAGR